MKKYILLISCALFLTGCDKESNNTTEVITTEIISTTEEYVIPLPDDMPDDLKEHTVSFYNNDFDDFASISLTLDVPYMFYEAASYCAMKASDYPYDDNNIDMMVIYYYDDSGENFCKWSYNLGSGTLIDTSTGYIETDVSIDRLFEIEYPEQ